MFHNSADCLLTNKDGFFTRLNNVNLYARNCSSVQEYKDRIKLAIYYPTIFDKIRIIYHILSIKYNISKVDSWVNINKFQSLSWNIVIFDGDYEGRMPHTRLNVIALPKSILYSNRLHEILLHEQLHVYQKAFPNDIRKYVKQYFIPIKSDYPDKIQNYRINPDTNGIIYKDRNNKILSCKFNSSQPNNLNDVKYSLNSARYEHPYELMVYEFVDIYMFK